MSTTPVANSVSSATSSAGRNNASRKSDSAGNPFQHMLSEEIAGKAQNSSKPEERVADAAGKQAASAPGDKTAKSDAATAEKAHDKAGEAAGKDESKEANVPGMPPELAALVASLLQQQQQQSAATGEIPVEDGLPEEADPLAAMGKGQSRLASDAQGKQDPLADLTNPKLADTSEQASLSSSKAAAQAASELELQAAVSGKPVSADAVGGESQPTEFSNVLQQLSQTAQAAQTRNGQPAAPAHLSPKVGTSAWDQALGQRVVWMATGTEQSASLTLNPPELGPLQVVLNVTNNQANATFIAPQAEVRQALEAAMPRLREMLNEAGIQLDQASVNQGAPQQQGEFARSAGQGGSRDQGREQSQGGGEATTAEPAASRRVTAAGNGLVDTFA